MSAFRPMQYKCSEMGCYNEKHRPDFGVFFDSLPGRISMSDIDATVEVSGHFLFIEFKSGARREIPVGQRIYHERLTRLSNKICSIIVFGDTHTKNFTHLVVVSNGKFLASEETCLADIKSRLKRWADKAQWRAFHVVKKAS